MKLFYSATSPFVRKVMVQAHEAGIVAALDIVDCTGTTPIDPLTANANPLKKVPALLLDDGTVLFDSVVVCEYLDAEVGDGSMLPRAGAGRWNALRLHAAANGLLDAAVLAIYETRLRPADKFWQQWADGQMLKIDGALAALEAEAAGFGGRIDIGTIAAACACGYLDFRYADKGWRDSHPDLAAWYADFAARPSMAVTAPPTA